MRAMWVMAAAAGAAAATACVPTLPKNPPPEQMDFDPQANPPRVPQPTSLIINPVTKHIDFSLAGLTIPSDCATATDISQAECEFDQYLQALDGFPTVTPAQAPASAVLDPATIAPATGNVVAFALRAQAPVTDLQVDFDTTGKILDARPKHWTIGEFYWLAVRGYANGVRAVDGTEVVAAPAQYLLKQDSSLTCGATDTNIDPQCPAYVLFEQQMMPADAAQSLLQLEAARMQMIQLNAYPSIAALGIPEDEVAVIWGFPVHSQSVAELDPSPAAMIVPRMPAPNQITVAVQGPVDPASVKAFVLQKQMGPVVVMDLNQVAILDLVGGLPPVDAAFVDGNIVITGQSAFPVGHVMGLFFTNAIHDAPGDTGRPLVPSPVSKLLTLRGSLIDSDGHSSLRAVSDSDAAMLEGGRQQLATLFDNQMLTGIVGISRESLVYCYAFQVAQP